MLFLHTITSAAKISLVDRHDGPLGRPYLPRAHRAHEHDRHWRRVHPPRARRAHPQQQPPRSALAHPHQLFPEPCLHRRRSAQRAVPDYPLPWPN